MSETNDLPSQGDPTAKDDELPADLQSEIDRGDLEGPSGSEDENGSGDEIGSDDGDGVDMVAEIGKQVPVKFTKAERTILINAKPQWMSCRGAARRNVLEATYAHLRKLEYCQTLSGDAWEARVQSYRTWFYNQYRSAANHSRIKIGRSWTARSVIQETHKERINQIISLRYGCKLGTKQALASYQRAVRRLVKRLTEEEKEAAENTAAEWNLDRGPPEDVKARNAVRYGQKVFREFAQEMWRACGMRVVIMAGWKQADGEVVTGIGDFNDEIHCGEKFDGINNSKIREAWDKYIGTHFEPEGEPNTDHSGSEDEECPPPQLKKKRLDPTSQVIRDDGSIWIEDIEGINREGLQSLVRGFLTAHYRVACGRPKTAAPFKKLPYCIQDMVDARHLPPGFRFTSDPSHMRTADTLTFLRFILNRQSTAENDVFKFHHWLDENGELQENVDDDDEEDEDVNANHNPAVATGAPLPENHSQSNEDTKESEGIQAKEDGIPAETESGNSHQRENEKEQQHEAATTAETQGSKSHSRTKGRKRHEEAAISLDAEGGNLHPGKKEGKRQEEATSVAGMDSGNSHSMKKGKGRQDEAANRQLGSVKANAGAASHTSTIQKGRNTPQEKQRSDSEQRKGKGKEQLQKKDKPAEEDLSKTTQEKRCKHADDIAAETEKTNPDLQDAVTDDKATQPERRVAKRKKKNSGGNEAHPQKQQVELDVEAVGSVRKVVNRKEKNSEGNDVTAPLQDAARDAGQIQPGGKVSKKKGKKSEGNNTRSEIQKTVRSAERDKAKRSVAGRKQTSGGGNISAAVPALQGAEKQTAQLETSRDPSGLIPSECLPPALPAKPQPAINAHGIGSKERPSSSSKRASAVVISKVDPVMIPLNGSEDGNSEDEEEVTPVITPSTGPQNASKVSKRQSNKAAAKPARFGTPYPNQQPSGSDTADVDTMLTTPSNRGNIPESQAPDDNTSSIRRSSRKRRPPVMADADVPTPEGRTPRKRKSRDEELPAAKRMKK